MRLPVRLFSIEDQFKAYCSQEVVLLGEKIRFPSKI